MDIHFFISHSPIAVTISSYSIQTIHSKKRFLHYDDSLSLSNINAESKVSWISSVTRTKHGRKDRFCKRRFFVLQFLKSRYDYILSARTHGKSGWTCSRIRLFFPDRMLWPKYFGSSREYLADDTLTYMRAVIRMNHYNIYILVAPFRCCFSRW